MKFYETQSQQSEGQQPQSPYLDVSLAQLTRANLWGILYPDCMIALMFVLSSTQLMRADLCAHTRAKRAAHGDYDAALVDFGSQARPHTLLNA